MKPGPTIVYQCPTCKKLVTNRSLYSGNTFGAKVYSDKKQIAPMLPEAPAIAICSDCKTIYWLNETNEIGEYDDVADNKIWNYAEKARFLTLKEYFMALEQKVYTNPYDEFLIRNWILWCFNDRIREPGKWSRFFGVPKVYTSEKEKTLWTENNEKLISLLDLNDVNEKIMIAELSRNLGRFERCVELWNSIDDADVRWLKVLVLKECEKKNSNVFQIR